MNRRLTFPAAGVRRAVLFVLTQAILIAVLTLPASAQSLGRVGTTAAPFLKIGVGSRAVSMGEAYSTQAEDPSGMFWNPSGIASVVRMQALYTHYAYIADISYDYGALAVPVEGVGTFGAFVGYMNFGEIERTVVQAPQGTGEKVTASSMVIGFSYARGLTDRFSIGGSAKYIREGIWHSSAQGFAFDVGVLYKAFFKDVRIGMSISNFGSSMQMDGRDMLVQHDIDPTVAGNNPNLNAHMDTDEFPLPILFRFGLSSNILRDFFEVEEYDWILAVDAVHPNDNKEYMNFGTEVGFLRRLVTARAGYRQVLLSNREGGFTWGLGVQADVADTRLNIDYANIAFGRLGNQNQFTLMIAF